MQMQGIPQLYESWRINAVFATALTPNPIYVIQSTHVDLLRFVLEYLTPTPTAQFSFNRRNFAVERTT